jgi:hypothetical protein
MNKNNNLMGNSSFKKNNFGQSNNRILILLIAGIIILFFILVLLFYFMFNRGDNKEDSNPELTIPVNQDNPQSPADLELPKENTVIENNAPETTQQINAPINPTPQEGQNPVYAYSDNPASPADEGLELQESQEQPDYSYTDNPESPADAGLNLE